MLIKNKMSWNLKEVYKALNLSMNNFDNIKFNNFSIDTRSIKKNDFFIPIVGDKYDGHSFIDKASELGVKACLVEKKKNHLVKNKKIHKIIVDDTKKSLEKLAIYNRKKNKNLTMICITGSSGKTTVKEWVGTILKKTERVYINPGNFNNEIGMPLSLINMPAHINICILEIGMNQYGEIRKLTKIAKPDIAIITNIGLAHVGNFKKPEDIASEKGEIFSFLNKNSYALIPSNSQYCTFLFKKASEKCDKIILFGIKNDSHVTFKEISPNNFLFSILETKIELKKNSHFKHWENNVLIILTILRILRLNLDNYKRNISKLEPLSGRGKLIKISNNTGTFFLIDETYNSNPQSLKNAIIYTDNLRKENQKLILVIGDMLELGKYSKKSHFDISKVITKISPKLVITVGKFSRIIYENLHPNIISHHFTSVENVYERLIEELDDSDIVMIKGSNSINLSIISERLKNN